MDQRMISPPEVEPVTVREAEARLGGVREDEAFLLSAMLVAARVFLEGEVGRVLIEQSWAATAPVWPTCGRLTVPSPLAPVTRIEAVTAHRGAEPIALDPGWFAIETAEEAPAVVTVDDRARHALEDAAGGIVVGLTAGYGPAPAQVPEPLRRAVLELAAHWFERREPIGFGRGTLPVPEHVRALTAPYVVARVQVPIVRQLQV